MKRLRHPIRSLTEPFGKAGLTVAVLALVMALVGGAYAAGGFTKSQEKQITKIAKKYAGKPGATGPAGTAGTNGTNGTNGKNGTNGTSGESVKIASASHEECPEGGSKFTIGAEKGKACNGSPWTAGGTLPKGKTETGTWSFSIEANGKEEASSEGEARVPISFPIPLAAPLEAPRVHFVTLLEIFQHEVPAECGENPEKPEAAEGNLCVYGQPSNTKPAVEIQNLGNLLSPEAGAATTGASLDLSVQNHLPLGEVARGGGTWAVTAP